MKKFIVFLVVIIFILVGVILFRGQSDKDLTFVTIGTGGVTGVYYPTGGAISRMINKKMDEYKIKATVESTAGSVYNVNAVVNGDLEFGVVQSDRQYQAWHGLAEWKDKGPQKDLRSIFAIHPESIVLVASARSEIKSVMDLKNKRVNLGNPGSGQLQNSKDAIATFGLTEKDIKAEYVKAVEAPGLLQDERIDAFFYTVGHPSGNIKEATSGRIKVRLIHLTGNPIDTLVKKYPYYTKAVTPIKFYPSSLNKEDVPSFGVKGTFLTRKNLDEEIVYNITKEIFNNLSEFKKLHPAYEVLNKKNMLEGLSAPIHRGALKYYKEAGLIGYINPKLIQ